MIEIHVHCLNRNKGKYSRDQLMNCSLAHCFHTLSADRLLAVTLLQSMPFSLSLIHTHTHTYTHTHTHTYTQPRIGLSKLSYTAATLNNRLVSQIIVLLNTELLIMVNFKFSCVCLIISIVYNIVSDL